MKITHFYKMLIPLTLLITAFSSDGCRNDENPPVEAKIEINEDFPIDEGGELSPPIVFSPIYECAEEVHISGFVPKATIKVYANDTELIAEIVSDYSFEDIQIGRPLKVGEVISATQTVNGKTSIKSIHPIVVEPLPNLTLNKPEINQSLYECGQIVPVSNLNPSVFVEVYEGGTIVGQGHSADAGKPVWVTPLTANRVVNAKQFACKKDQNKLKESDFSNSASVTPAPNPMPSPVVDPQSLFVGNDAVTLSNLLTGAKLTIYDNGNVVGGGYTTGSANWAAINVPMTANSVITATQELCGNDSPPSDPEKPQDKLLKPLLIEPICKYNKFVVVQNTVNNSHVVILKNNTTIIGYGGGRYGDLVLSLNNNANLNTGDIITAVQYAGQTVSPKSNSVTVVNQSSSPLAEISAGELFFMAEAGESQIDAPVFLRGSTNAPSVKIVTCCEDDDIEISASIITPDNQKIKNINTKAIFPGYYSITWDWQSDWNWAVPNEIPVGKYVFKIESNCGQEDLDIPFYVIFNPADVNGPSRFSFNETGIWFGANNNGLRALVYHLHPDDKRVFDIAIKAASGSTDTKQAAQKICDAEENLFSYSLNYHSNDVIDMLENYTEAQCADDANVLTALLRAVGIPAHPATADAALETGEANWTFDTWTEFLTPNGSTNEWLILHPHQYVNMIPETRTDFGTNRGVATSSFNDVIVMADDNWDYGEASDYYPDVSYARNTCNAPEQFIAKSAWVRELCEQGYWNPGHWSCGSPTAGAALAGRQVGNLQILNEVNFGNAGFGRTLSSKLNITYAGLGDTITDLSMQIIGDIPESKKFPDFVYSTVEKKERIQRLKQFKDEYELDIPQTVPAGVELYHILKVNEKIVETVPIAMSSSLEIEVDTLKKVRLGKTRRYNVKVRNKGKQVIDNVDISIETPHAVDIERTKRNTKIARIMPGEVKEISFDIKALSPMEAGRIRIKVNSENGGGSVSELPFFVPSDDPYRLITPIEKRD